MQQSSIGRCAALLCRAAVPRCCGTSAASMCSADHWNTFQVKSDRTFQVKSDLTSRKLTQNQEKKLDLMVRYTIRLAFEIANYIEVNIVGQNLSDF